MKEILKLIDGSNVKYKDKIKTYIIEQEFMIRQLEKNNSQLLKNIDKLMENIKGYENILTSIEKNL